MCDYECCNLFFKGIHELSRRFPPLGGEGWGLMNYASNRFKHLPRTQTVAKPLPPLHSQPHPSPWELILAATKPPGTDDNSNKGREREVFLSAGKLRQKLIKNRQGCATGQGIVPTKVGHAG
jgi:hypothetical protein